MEIETKKSYVIKITHEERRVMLNALAYAAEHGMDKTQCNQIFDEFVKHNKEE